MILRRITQHVKDQNWFAVGLDFLIVVVGVFVGLQVSNWNDVQKEEALERTYLERLSEDIASSAQRAQENIADHEQQIVLETVMLDALSSCTLDDETRTDFVNGIFGIGQFEPPSLVRGTIDELQSTGRIGIISNISLRRELTEMLDQHRRRSEVLGYIIERVSPQIAYVDSRRVINLPDGEDFYPDLNPEWVSFDFPALCKDPRYAGAVSSIQLATAVTRGHNKQMLTQYEGLLHMLEEELGVAIEPKAAIDEAQQ